MTRNDKTTDAPTDARELTKPEKDAIKQEIRSIEKYAKYMVMLLNHRRMPKANRDWMVKALKVDNARLSELHCEIITPAERRHHFAPDDR